MTWKDLKDLLDALTALHAIAVAAGLGGLIPLARWIKRTRGASRERAARLEKLLGMADKIDRIAAAVLPNRGSSLPDKIDRLEELFDRADALRQALWRQMDSRAFTLNAQGDFEHGNRAFYRLTKMTPLECRAHGWINAFEPADRARIRAELEAASAGVPSDYLVPARLANRPEAAAVILSGTAIVGRKGSCYGWSIEAELSNPPTVSRGVGTS